MIYFGYARDTTVTARVITYKKCQLCADLVSVITHFHRLRARSVVIDDNINLDLLEYSYVRLKRYLLTLLRSLRSH